MHSLQEIIYFPPVLSAKAQLNVYKQACRKFVKWLVEQLRKCPRSATPFTSSDVDDGIGIAEGENGKRHVLGTSVVHEDARRRENIVQGVGALLREVLDEAHLVSLSFLGD